MTVLILMAVVFLGARGVAAGCKWGGARVGWLSFLALTAAGAFLAWRHGVWPLVPPVLAWPMRPALAGWAFVPRDHLPRNRVRGKNIRLHLRLHPGAGHATAFELHRHWGGSRSRRGSPVTPGRT